MKIIIILVLSLIVYKTLAPNSEERYDVGFNDGYAVGYNTECKIRTTIVEGDWDDKNYSSGYKNGKQEGVNACRNKN
tara:strand:- start:232 stop:462 length:231 start_codon:yes stop_codon:yes gene_type:complete